MVDASTGGFYLYAHYDCTEQRRQRQARPLPTRIDTFNVTVIDGKGGSATVLVGAVVSPASQNDPGPGTGEPGHPSQERRSSAPRTHQSGSSPDWSPRPILDGDTPIYSSPVSTAKGAVAVNANTGAFTYTPTATARHAAAQNGALAASTTDSFAVTASDGKGSHGYHPRDRHYQPCKCESDSRNRVGHHTRRRHRCADRNGIGERRRRRHFNFQCAHVDHQGQCDDQRQHGSFHLRAYGHRAKHRQRIRSHGRRQS